MRSRFASFVGLLEVYLPLVPLREIGISSVGCLASGCCSSYLYSFWRAMEDWLAVGPIGCRIALATHFVASRSSLASCCLVNRRGSSCCCCAALECLPS